jgi:cell division inhibitor SepF
MGVTDKFWNLFGIQEECNDIQVLPRNESLSGLNVASINYGKGLKVIVCEAEQFEEVTAIVDHIKNKKQVILNFENTRPDISQKIIDFVSGAVYALNGQCLQLGQNIFAFAPSSVEIIKDKKDFFFENDTSSFDRFKRKR